MSVDIQEPTGSREGYETFLSLVTSSLGVGIQSWHPCKP